MGAGAVFADRNQTDLANAIANGLLLVAGKGIKVESVRTGTPSAQYEISLDPAESEKIDGGGDGSNSSGVAVYETTEWAALSDPQDAVVLVYDQTEDPQPKPGYYTATGIYVRKKSIAVVDPASMDFAPEGETKAVSLTVNAADKWTAECIGSGFSADVLAGTGPATVNVTATENNVEMTRTGKLVVTCRGKTMEATLYQAAKTDEIPLQFIGALVQDGVSISWVDNDGQTITGVSASPGIPSGSNPDGTDTVPQTVSYKRKNYLAISFLVGPPDLYIYQIVP